MRKIIMMAFATATMLIACDDFQASDNGDLDGFWQLAEVDSLPSGRHADVRELGIFWAVQANLLEVRDTKKEHVDVFFRFELNGNALTLSQPVADDRPISDSIVTDVNTLRYYGLGHLTERLEVLHLDRKKMTLENERLRMFFNKY